MLKIVNQMRNVLKIHVYMILLVCLTVLTKIAEMMDAVESAANVQDMIIVMKSLNAQQYLIIYATTEMEQYMANAAKIKFAHHGAMERSGLIMHAALMINLY